MKPDGIRQLRKLAAISQQELARRSGVDRARISLFERGRTDVRTKQFAQLERILLREIAARGTRIQNVLGGRKRMSKPLLPTAEVPVAEQVEA